MNLTCRILNSYFISSYNKKNIKKYLLNDDENTYEIYLFNS